jgi:hypothetical protein
MKMPPEFQGFEDGLSSVFGDVGQGRPFILQVRAADGGESSTHTVAGWYSKRAARASPASSFTCRSPSHKETDD